MKESSTINSYIALTAFISNVKKLFEEHKYITYDAPRIGKDRSLNQNSLFHVWISQYAAHLLRIDRRELSDGEKEGMKHSIKAKFKLEYPDRKWMVHEVYSPMTEESKLGYTSSAKWKKGEMFEVLTWLQMHAANDELILESKGEFLKNQREQTET